MLSALRAHKPRGFGLIKRLWNSIQSLRSVPHPVEERRTVPRLVCELPIVMLLDGGARGGTLEDVGLFGLSVRVREPLEKGYLVRMLLAQDESLEEVICKVRWCHPMEKECLLGLRYHQAPEALSQSWVCSLLHELGYDFEQRRQFIRAKSDIPSKLSGASGHLLDIGVGGALFQSAIKTDSSGPKDLNLGPYHDLPALHIRVLVKNLRQADGVWLHSLEFLEPDDQQTDILGRYVLDLIAQRAEESQQSS